MKNPNIVERKLNAIHEPMLCSTLWGNLEMLLHLGGVTKLLSIGKCSYHICRYSLTEKITVWNCQVPKTEILEYNPFPTIPLHTSLSFSTVLTKWTWSSNTNSRRIHIIYTFFKTPNVFIGEACLQKNVNIFFLILCFLH